MFNLNTGVCPYCKKVIQHVKLENMPIHVDIRVHNQGVSFVCPTCKAILGITYDPFPLVEDIVQGVSKALKGKRHQ